MQTGFVGTSMRAWQEGEIRWRARGSNDGQAIPVLECEPFVYKRPSPRTLAQINPDLVAGSSSSLSRSSLSTLPSEDRGVTLRTRFRWKAVKHAIQTQWMATTLTSERPTASTAAELAIWRAIWTGCLSACSLQLFEPLKTSFLSHMTEVSSGGVKYVRIGNISFFPSFMVYFCAICWYVLTIII